MSDQLYQAYPAVWQPQPTPAAPLNHVQDRRQDQRTDGGCAALLRLALTGAMVGGSAAAATNLRRVQAGEIASGEAVAATARTAAVAAAATAAAGAVADAIADQGLLRLGIMFAVGTAVVYGLDQWRQAQLEVGDV